MSYSYDSELPQLMTTEGVTLILNVLIRARRLSAEAGAVRAGKLLSCGQNTQSTFAAIEFLTRGKYLRIVRDTGRGQDMVLEMPL